MSAKLVCPTFELSCVCRYPQYIHSYLHRTVQSVHFFFFFLRGISTTGINELLESEIPGFLVKPNTRVFNSKRGIKRWKSREQGSTLLEVCFKYMKIFLWSQESEGRLIIHQKIFMHVRFSYWYKHIPADSARRKAENPSQNFPCLVKCMALVVQYNLCASKSIVIIGACIELLYTRLAVIILISCWQRH